MAKQRPNRGGATRGGRMIVAGVLNAYSPVGVWEWHLIPLCRWLGSGYHWWGPVLSGAGNRGAKRALTRRWLLRYQRPGWRTARHLIRSLVLDVTHAGSRQSGA